MKFFGNFLFLTAVESCQHHMTNEARQVTKPAVKPVRKIRNSRMPKGDAPEMTCTASSCTACMAGYDMKPIYKIHTIQYRMMYRCCHTKLNQDITEHSFLKKTFWNKYSLGWFRRPVLSILLD